MIVWVHHAKVGRCQAFKRRKTPRALCALGVFSLAQCGCLTVHESTVAFRQNRSNDNWICGIMLGLSSRSSCVRRHLGISSATFYQRRSESGGMEASDIKRLKDLEQENRRLKQMYADPSLDHRIRKDIVDRKLSRPGIAGTCPAIRCGSLPPANNRSAAWWSCIDKCVATLRNARMAGRSSRRRQRKWRRIRGSPSGSIFLRLRKTGPSFEPRARLARAL